MFNIVFVGLLYESNLGDKAICECCVDIVNRINIENNKKYEFRYIDLYGRNKHDIHKPVTFFAKFVNKLKRMVLSKNQEDQIIVQLQKQCEEVINDDTKAIIFTGGGLIKYNHQFISKPVIDVLSYANKKSIPVIISATGVEGYDDNDTACIELKNALNLPCVKMITTRDDISLLNDKWIDRENIETALVADPACSLNKIYTPKRKQHKLIGLGIGRANLFTDYECSITNDQIKSVWCKLYSKLKAEGFDCVFFTNGLEQDEAFAKDIISTLNEEENKVKMSRPEDVSDLVDNISCLDGAIVTRLHSSIISYSYSIPFVGLVWNNKQKMFGECIGHPECFLEKDDINADTIFARFMQVYSHGDIKRDEQYCETTSLYIEEFLRKYVYEK